MEKDFENQLPESFEASSEQQLELNAIYLQLQHFRKNSSAEADEILQRVKNGHNPTKSEIFAVICDNQQQAEQFAKFEAIRQRANDGKLTEADIDFLATEAFGKDTREAEEVSKHFKARFTQNEREL